MALQKRASLLALPPEILCIACSNLSQQTVNSLVQTCRTLRFNATPILYESVVLRVPMKWSRLPTLESLVSSSGENLRWIRRLAIDTQHDSIRKNQRGPTEDIFTQDEPREHSKLFTLPSAAASHTLNILIRVLVARLPENGLQSLKYHSVTLFALLTADCFLAGITTVYSK